MKNTVGKIVMVSILIFSTSTLALSPANKSNIILDNNNQLTFTPTTDITYFYTIPSNQKFDSLTLISHSKESMNENSYTTTFYTTDQPLPTDYTYKPCLAKEPYSYEILKKGYDSVLRISIPSKYSFGSEIYNTTSITLQINLIETPEPTILTQKSNTFMTQNYESQADTYEYLIITNKTFWPLLYNYFKDWKISTDNKINNILITNVSTIINNSLCDVNGTYGDGNNANTWISGIQLTSDWEMFNDTQAHIRNYIRYCYDIYTTRYVLLFGNAQVVPPRMACSYAAGNCPGCTGYYNDTSHASDLYYSNLHYNMNNNTNSYWMENAVCGSPVDAIDWGFDLNVGRVIVNQPFETFWWINKTKNYVNGNNQSNYTKWAVVPCKDNGNSISNQTWTGWDGSELGPNIGDEFPSNISFINNQNITQAQWNNLANYANGNAGGLNGLTLIYHAGHGGTLWTPYSDSNLNNLAVPNFIYTEGCTSANFGEDTSSRMEDWLSDNGAAFGGISNSAYGWFIGSTYYGELMMRELFNESNTSILCTAHNNARERYGHDPDCIWGMLYKETNFFGDPALEWTWYTGDKPHLISIDSNGNSSIVTNSTPTFIWSKVNNTINYYLQLSLNSSFTNIVTNISDISIISYPSYYTEDTHNVTFILPPEYALTYFGNTYYIRLRADRRV